MWKFVIVTLLIVWSETYMPRWQTFTVSGNISSSKNGEGIYGVSILYTKTAGTTTDTEGNFVIYGLRPGKYKLRLRTLNFLKKDTTIIIKDSSIYNLNLKMKEVKKTILGDI